MKRIVLVLLGALMSAAVGVAHSQAAAKGAAKAAPDAKALAAEQLGKAQDRAAANYKKNKGMSMDAKPAAMGAKAAAKK